MNIYTKYWPLLYTFHTRRKTLKFTISCLLLDIVFWFLSIIYLVIIWKVSIQYSIILLFIHYNNFYLYNVFYEIWYIYNDVISIKKETNPTLRIADKLPSNFVFVEIIIRLIFWTILLGLIYLINKNLSIQVSIIILSMLLVFVFHNIIRNYLYNFITFYLLRFSKFLLIFPILYLALWTFNNNIYLYITILYTIMQFWINLNVFNNYLWWTSKTHQSYNLFYLLLNCIVFYILTRDLFFWFYFWIYLIIFLIKTPKELILNNNTR